MQTRPHKRNFQKETCILMQKRPDNSNFTSILGFIWRRTSGTSCTGKMALYFRTSALYFRKRAQYLRKRALYSFIQKSPIFLQASPIFLPNSPIFSQKSPTSPQKSLFSRESALYFRNDTPGCIGAADLVRPLTARLRLRVACA